MNSEIGADAEAEDGNFAPCYGKDEYAWAKWDLGT